MATTFEEDPLLKPIPLVEGWKVLAPVVLYAKIGQGGMGSVYRGRHLDFDIDVAVKCLKPSLAAEDEQFIARFRREARLAAGLTHENLVRVYDYRRAYGLHYLVMEFVDGETARERVMRKGALNEYEAAAIIMGAARGLSKAHRNEETIVHRDVKPDNILISRRGEVKLADLGIAKALENDGDGATFNTQGVIGTPQYMAPEQWERDQAMGPQSDIWSFGATLFFLLTGENAIRAGTEKQVYVDICQKPFPDVRTKRPEVSSSMAAILKKCLRKEMSERYADAGELADALAGFIGTQAPSLVDQGTGTERTMALVSPPPMPTMKRIRVQVENATDTGSTPPPGGTIVIRQSDPRWWWIGGGVAAAGVAIFLGIKFLGGNGGGAEAKSGISGVEGLVGGKFYAKDLSAELIGLVNRPDGTDVISTLGAAPAVVCDVNSKGAFRVPLTLKADSSEELKLSFGDRQPFTCTVVQDSKPPKIEILEPSIGHRTINAKSIKVRLKLVEDNLKNVVLGSEEFKQEPDGTWSANDVRLVMDTELDLEIVATDLAGNSTRETLTVVRDMKAPELLGSNPKADAELAAGKPQLLDLEFNEDLVSAKIDDKEIKPNRKHVSAEFSVPTDEREFSVPYTVVDLAGNSVPGSLSFKSKLFPIPRIVLVPDIREGEPLYLPGTTLELGGSVENASANEITLRVDDSDIQVPLEGKEHRINILRKLPKQESTRIELSYADQVRKFVVIQDTLKPVISKVSPKAGERTKNKQIVVSAFVEEKNLKNVTVGASPMEQLPDGSWSKNVDLAEGSNEFEIHAEDLAGNAAAVVKVTVERDMRPPDLVDSSIKEGANVDAGAPFALELKFDERLGAATIDGKTVTPTDKAARREWTANSTPGPWRVPITVEDLAGNPTSTTLTFNVTAKTPKLLPSLRLELAAATDGTIYTKDEAFAFKCNVANGEGEPTASLDGKPIECKKAGAKYEISTKLPPDKASTIEVRYGPLTETANVFFDSKDPVVSLDEPAADSLRTNQPALRVSVRVTEANLKQVQLDTRAMNDAGSGKWQLNPVNLVEGANNFKIVATDLAGRTSPAKSLSITLDTKPPLIESSNPKDGAAVEAGKPLALKLTFNEDVKSLQFAGADIPGSKREATLNVDVPAGTAPWTVEGTVEDLLGNVGPFKLSLRRGSEPSNVASGIQFPGFEATGELNALGYARTIKHTDSGIELVAVDLGANTKPTLYVSSGLVTERQYSGQGAASPKLGVSAVSIVDTWSKSGRGKRLSLPNDAEWQKIAQSSVPAVQFPPNVHGELLQGEFQKSSWPTRSNSGKSDSEPKLIGLSAMGFRVVFRVP